MNHIKYEKKIRKLSISILFFLPVLIFICDSCGCDNNNTSSKAKTTKNTVSNKNSNTTDHKSEKRYKELQNNKEKGEKEKGEEKRKRQEEEERKRQEKEERKRQEEEEREKRGKEIQDQIARLEDLINYNDLPSKKTIIEIFTLKDDKGNNIPLNIRIIQPIFHRY